MELGQTERRLLGWVDVDSGTLLLGDPLHALPERARGRAGIDYQAVMDAPEAHALPLDGKPVLLLSRFGGDGLYPVFGEFEDGDLVRATVEFAEPEEPEEPEAAGAGR